MLSIDIDEGVLKRLSGVLKITLKDKRSE